MSLFCVKTQDLSWQDRTINIEFMMAPSRSQLLLNKHKGLKTKCQQETSNLEREKSAYVKGHKIEQRLMERRKEVYSKRRNDIIMRRSAGDPRRRGGGALEPGRASAPPRLEEHTEDGDNCFLTQIVGRDSKSADARTSKVDLLPREPPQQRPLTTHLLPPAPATPEVTIKTGNSPGISRTPTPGKPFLERSKSVRFNNIDLGDSSCENPPAPIQELSIDERIQRFLSDQDDFNRRKINSASQIGRGDHPDKKVLLARRYSAIQVNMQKLENAFDEFCDNNTNEGLQTLVKFATKMRAHVRTARNASLVPSLATSKAVTAFRGFT